MKSFIFTAAVAMLLIPASVFAADKAKNEKVQALKENLESHVQVHGFIRNYFAFDTRESVSGTGDLFYYVPKDQKMVGDEDLNAVNQFRFLALTSRLWVDVNGYQIQNTSIGAKIEADFYCGLTGTTGTAQFRLRQAYVTLGWQQEKAKESLKIGQAWHPMAADMPDVFSLNTGAPFGAFSRTPVAQFDAKFGKWFGLTAAAIWQQQYPSSGPAGKSANYIKYGCTPEGYFGLNFTPGNFVIRTGVDVLSIAPRVYDTPDGSQSYTKESVDGVTGAVTKTTVKATKKVNERITTATAFAYFQYATKFGDVPFSIKAKSSYGQAGEHLCLNGGYGVSSETDGVRTYTPSTNSSTWVSLSAGKKFQGVLFGGYVKNFGTKDELLDPTKFYYFSGNSFSNMSQMWRLTPTFMYNLGKFTFGVEYELTSIQYGDWDPASDSYKHALATKDLRWITNHRVQAMVKFTF